MHLKRAASYTTYLRKPGGISHELRSQREADDFGSAENDAREQLFDDLALRRRIAQALEREGTPRNRQHEFRKVVVLRSRLRNQTPPERGLLGFELPDLRVELRLPDSSPRQRVDQALPTLLISDERFLHVLDRLGIASRCKARTAWIVSRLELLEVKRPARQSRKARVWRLAHRSAGGTACCSSGSGNR